MLSNTVVANLSRYVQLTILLAITGSLCVFAVLPLLTHPRPHLAAAAAAAAVYAK